MFWRKSKEKEKELKALSEKEIQKQLYGEYLGKKEQPFEVMDSSAILESKNERPIEEKYDAKIKQELGEELDNLRGEFKRLKDEVTRLKKKREALERTETALKLPFLKTQHLIIIGSAVVLLLIVITSILVIKFMFTKVTFKKAKVAVVERSSKRYTIQAYTTTKKEDLDKVIQLLYSKGVPTTVKESKSSSGKNQYVIYVGEYFSKKEASETIQRLKKDKEFKDSFVRTK